MGSQHFDEDKRCLILADYLDGMLIRDIVARHGCACSYPTELAKRSGFPGRRPRTQDTGETP
jgi:hypothetical protein